MYWSVKKKLYAAFGVIIGLVAMLGAFTIYRMRVTEELQSESHRYEQVAITSLEMMETLLRSRRNEKDYFIRSEEKYAQLQTERRADFDKEIAHMEELLTQNDGEYTKLLKRAKSEYDAYQTTFAEAAASHARRGTQDSGLQKEFRDAAHEMEAIAEKASDDKLLVLVLELRRAEKDYLLRELPKFSELHKELLAQTRHHVAQNITGATASELTTALEVYGKKFQEAVAEMERLAQLKNVLHDRTEALEVTLPELVNEAKASSELHADEVVDGRRTAEMTILALFTITVGMALFIARLFALQSTRAIEELMRGTRLIATGKLASRVDVKTGDEYGTLGKSFNDMGDALKGMVGHIGEASSGINEVVKELQASVSEQAAAMQQQASSVSETVATVDEILRSANQVAETAAQVLSGAQKSLESSSEGREAIANSVEGMSAVREQVENIAATILDLSEKTQRIGTIIATVDDFAEQSSLLALNASIEAARAGENGKAFSVVASEVKKLAEQSRKATEQVRAILTEIQQTTHSAVMVTEEGSKRVDRGVTLVNAAGQVIAQLAVSIEQSADSAKQISAASRQQANGMEQIASAMSGIDQFSKQNVEAIRQTESTSHALGAVAQQLRTTTARYEL